MARKIVILEKTAQQPTETAFRFALWADVPVARQARYANAEAVTQVADATQTEIDAIRAGQIAERVEEGRWPQGTTLAQVQGLLEARFNAFQAQITAANEWQRYGSFWDGTTWTVVNNA